MRPIQSFEKCFAEFIEPDTPEKRQKLSDMLGIKDESTIRRWFTKRSKPLGKHKLCLKVYLTDMGWRIDEFERLRPVFRDAVRIFAYGIATFDEIVLEFGYTLTNRESQVMTVLQGRKDMQTARITRGQVFVESKRNALESVVRKSVRAMRDVPPSHEPTAPPQQTTSAAHNEYVKREILSGISRLMPLVAHATTKPTFTAKDRKDLRDRAGFGTLAEFATAVNRLCGETILKQLARAAQRRKSR